jgi:hypothetical protein
LPSQQLLQNCCKISEISSEEKKTRQKISERRRRPTEARAEAVCRPLALPQQWRLQHSRGATTEDTTAALFVVTKCTVRGLVMEKTAFG